MANEPQRHPADLLPVIAFIVAVAVLVGGWFLFPKVHAWISTQDCVASGRTNCVQYDVQPR